MAWGLSYSLWSKNWNEKLGHCFKTAHFWHIRYLISIPVNANQHSIYTKWISVSHVKCTILNKNDRFANPLIFNFEDHFVKTYDLSNESLLSGRIAYLSWSYTLSQDRLLWVKIVYVTSGSFGFHDRLLLAKIVNFHKGSFTFHDRLRPVRIVNFHDRMFSSKIVYFQQGSSIFHDYISWF